jgi:peptidase E
LDPEDLLEKIKTHDVLYVAGGDADLIEPLISRMNGLANVLKGKVYIGCSMGAFIVSSHYVLSFNKDHSIEVHHGLGLLHFDTLCHWNVEKQKDLKLELLKKSSPQSRILLLDECQYSVFVV